MRRERTGLEDRSPIRPRKRLLRLLVLTSIALAASGSSASQVDTAFVFPIPDLVGNVPRYPAPINLDLGVSFSDIRDVFIVIEATTTPFRYGLCPLSATPASCDTTVIPGDFLVFLEGPGRPGSDVTWAVVEGFRDSYPRRQSAVFQRPFLDFNFDHLNDGTATLRLTWNSPSFLQSVPILQFLPRNYQPATGEITAAELVVVGTPLVPVPEPGHGLALVCGILALAGLKRRHSLR